METEEYCASCDGNACQGCDSCNGACQDNAEKVSKELGTFEFRKGGLDTNDLFLTKEEWNSLITYIKKGYDLGGASGGDADYNGEVIRVNSGDYMTANRWNGAYARMKWLSTNNNSLGGQEKERGQLILADYFTDLENYANNSFKTTWCDGSCEFSCNSCDSETEIETYEYCCSCDSCEGCEGNDSEEGE